MFTSDDQTIRDSENFQARNEMRMFHVDAPDKGIAQMAVKVAIKRIRRGFLRPSLLI